MKKIACAVLTVLMLSSAYAQTVISFDDLKNSRTKFDNNAVQAAKEAKKNTNGSRAIYQFDLDYDAADEQYATDLGFDYARFGNNVNTRFNSGPPADTTDNFTAKWIAVKFDTLYDGLNQVGYPLAGATITVDSIFFLVNHTNTSGLEDTLIVRILEIAGTTSGLLSADMGVTLTNNVLWADTTITTTSLTPGLSAGQITALAVGPNFTLPTGSGYIVQILYSAPKEDVLTLVDGNRDECGGSCVYAESIFSNNSWGYLNWFRFGPPASNLSGVPQLIGLAADCNQDGEVKSEDCEFFSYQNFAIWSSVTVDVPLSVSVAQNNIAGCPGTSVPLTANAVGGTAPYDYSWSNGQSDAVISVSVGNTTETYTVTVTDADNEVRTATVTVTSQGVGIDLGADQALACGQTTNLSPSVSGNVVGATYTWNTGPTTLNLTGVGAGTYSITVSNSAGCSASDNVVVSLAGTSQALNFNSPSQYIRNCPLAITNQSVNTTEWNFEWNFGDGNLAFDANPTHTWSSLGSFVITLVADSFGCQLTRTKSIQIVNGNCPGVGIDEQLLNNISIYPNPTNGKFVVTLESVAGKNAVVNVVNMNGQVVVSEKFTATGNDAKEFDLASFSNGLYLVNIQVDGRIASKTILKQ